MLISEIMKIHLRSVIGSCCRMVLVGL